MNTTSCPPREKLKDYLAGWSEPEFLDAIESHLSECLDCEKTVVELESDPDTLLEHLRPIHLPQHAGLYEDPGMHSVLSRARRLIDSSLALGESMGSRQDWMTPEIGAYEILRPLGRGGMGSVFLARHRQLGKQVAIKLLPAQAISGDHFAARFQREIRAAGELQHPAIVNSTDAGLHEGTHYLVMEFIDGLDLSRVARLLGKLAIADACEILRTVALGLSYAHSIGVVHRDVKPSNMMLSATGQVKILDFGLAQHSLWEESSAELTTVGQLMGTLDYMAPEQAERADAVDYRADLYSLGATLFRLLCGHPPLAVTPSLSPLAKLRLLANHEAPSLEGLRPDAPAELVALLKSLLSRAPDDRPASAAHVAEQLSAFTHGADLIGLISHACAKLIEQPEEILDKIPNTSPLLPQPADAVAAASRNDGKYRYPWLTLVAFLPLMLAGILFTLELQKGQLVIESDVASVSVSLLKNGEYYQQLKIEPGATSTRLYAGKYQIEIAEGSDSLQFDDQQFTIQKGKTTIARVRREPTTSSPAPASEADRESWPLAESHSIEREILELEIKAQELKTKVGKGHPTLIALESKLQLLRDFAERSKHPTKSELLFEGKTLAQWLDVLTHERSPETLNNAFLAINALIVPETRQIISETVLRNLPRLNGEMRLKPTGGSGRGAALDTEAFRLLRRATETDSYYPLLVRELDSTQDMQWRQRILQSVVFNPVDSSPVELVDWLQANVFEAKEPSPLLKVAANIVTEFLLFQPVPISAALEDRMLSILDDCRHLTHDYWLGNLFSDQIPPGSKYVARVCTHAIAAIGDPKTPLQYVVQAVQILASLRSSLPELLGEEGVDSLHTVLRARLASLASNQEQLMAATELSSPFKPSPPPGILDTATRSPIHVITSRQGASTACLTVELLAFVRQLGVGTQLSSELEALVHATTPLTHALVQQSLFLNPYATQERAEMVGLLWPSLKVDGASGEKFSVDPTAQQWLALIIRTEALWSLPEEISKRLHAEDLRVLKPDWTKAMFAQFDKDRNSELSQSEFAAFYAARFGRGGYFSLADRDGNSSINIEELLAYLENNSPSPPISAVTAKASDPLDWAKRQIGKYDLNGDGQLTANEWDKMIVTPLGADANKDGIITAVEYANFRTPRP